MIESVEATDLSRLLEPAIIILSAILAGYILARVILPGLQRLASQSRWRGDDVVLDAIRRMVLLWFVLGGIYLSTLGAPVGSRLVVLVRDALLIIFILSLTITAIRVAIGLVTPNIEEGGTTTAPVLTIITNVIRIVAYGIGLTIILQLLDVPITPALAIVGVGGLAVSLAVQETLANIVSGILLILAKQVRPGNYIKLSTGQEGYVTDINWRTTQIRELPNNMIIVPNSVMTSAILTNYYDPDKELAILIDVGVSYDSDLDHVERVTMDVGREVMQEVAGGVPVFDPFIRYNKFDDSRINFTVILRGREFVDQYLIKHEFVKRLHRRYRQEGIEIAFPIRMIYTKDSNHRQITSSLHDQQAQE